MKVKISWTEIGSHIDRLAQTIAADGHSFDQVVAISRGGLVLGVALAHKFNVPLVTVDISSYDNDTQRALICNTSDVVFKSLGKCLCCDDLVDSGETLSFLQKKIVDVRATAVIFYKERSIVTPDYFAEKTDQWICFPWEY